MSLLLFYLITINYLLYGGDGDDDEVIYFSHPVLKLDYYQKTDCP